MLKPPVLRALRPALALLVLSGSGCALTQSVLGSGAGGGDDTITTSVGDAPKEQLAPDALKLPEERSLTAQRPAPEGGFQLAPGLYEAELKSFCLHAGKARGGKGTAYLPAPLKGPRAAAVRSILKNWSSHPELTQGEVQSLVWAILAKSKVTQGSPSMVQAAKSLLSPKELADLDGGAAAILSKEAMNQLTARLPYEVKKVMEAENALREQFASAQASYEDLEKIAAPEAPDPGPAKGTWTKTPKGYFIRYFPNGYQQTRVQVLVPEAASAQHVPLQPGKHYAQTCTDPPTTNVDVGENVAAPNNETAQRLAMAPPSQDAPRRMESHELTKGPSKRGNAPIGKDGHPVELHHRHQTMDSPLDEMTRTEHRLGENYKKNHCNTGQEKGQIDRKAFDKEREEYWKKEWDSGRFKDL